MWFKKNNARYCSVKDLYWSGLRPYCAYCKREIREFIHYIKPKTAAQINWLDLDMGYFYLCPNEENHDGAKMRQAVSDFNHVLLAYLVSLYVE